MRKGKLEEAMKTLQKLRGSSYRGVEEEVAAILNYSFFLHHLHIYIGLSFDFAASEF